MAPSELHQPDSILLAMRCVAKKAAKSGELLRVDEEASRLIEAHPDSGVLPDEVRDTLSRIAVSMGVSLAIGK